MFGQRNQAHVGADLAYRLGRISTDLHRSRRPFGARWPVGLIGSRPRRPRALVRPMPSPHHAISLG
jgi:hypothetical protein